MVNAILERHLEVETERNDPNLGLRSAISREIHDGLGQRFFVAALYLERIGLELRKLGVPQPVTSHLEVVLASIKDGQLESRHLIEHLRGRDRESGTLPQLLAGLGRQVEGVGRRFELILTGEPHVHLAPEEGWHLYRVAQEAVANSIRHATATRVEIHLLTAEEGFRLEISDDGEATAMPPSPGMGMTSMRERAALLGARICFGSGSYGFVVEVRRGPGRSTRSVL